MKTLEADKVLNENYLEKGPKWCAEQLGVSYGHCTYLARKLKLNHRDWKREKYKNYLLDNLFEKGYEQCAIELETTTDYVYQLAKELSIPRPLDRRGGKLYPFTKEQKEKILLEYPKDSCTVISKRMNIGVDSVIGFIKRENKYIGFNRRVQKCVNQDFFSWTPDFAYILGYMYADGSVFRTNRREENRKNGVMYCSSITSKDKQILNDIRSVMGLEAKVAEYQRDGKWYYSLNSYSKWIYDKWKSYGVKENKSKVGLPVPKLQKRLVRHFIRGFFDGDGSWYFIKNKYECVGFGCTDRKFIAWIRDVVIENTDIDRTPMITLNKFTKTPFYSFNLYTKYAVLCRRWMKPRKNQLRLDRKWKIEIK